MKKTMMLAAAVFAMAASAAVTVTGVSAHTRWPWNGLVDVDFTISDSSVADLYKVEVRAAYAGGTKTICASTYLNEPLVGTGTHRVTWDLAADFPELKVDDLQVAVVVAPLSAAGVDASDVYMVIDLSSGPNSSRYPVRYTTAAPTLVSTNDLVACAADPNRTTKLWLKRMKAGTFPFGGTDCNKGAGDFKVSLSPFYIGVFELTQMQYALVMNAWPSVMTNVAYRAARPVTNVNYEDVIGHNNWPNNRTMSEGSYIAKMRARTGLATFSLPTEAQWEYACRAGGKKSIYASASTGRYNFVGATTYNEAPNEASTALVGSYNANAWGLYDTLGNVWEMCLDAFASVEDLKTLYNWDNELQTPVPDPIGPAVNATPKYHATRGGGWNNSESGFCSAHRRDRGNLSNFTGLRRDSIGFRVAVSPDWQ